MAFAVGVPGDGSKDCLGRLATLERTMIRKSRAKLMLACFAFGLGLSFSLSAVARPCCSSCNPDDPDSRCWAICSDSC
jgi:hypothetical protein